MFWTIVGALQIRHARRVRYIPDITLDDLLAPIDAAAELVVEAFPIAAALHVKGSAHDFHAKALGLAAVADESHLGLPQAPLAVSNSIDSISAFL